MYTIKHRIIGAVSARQLILVCDQIQTKAAKSEMLTILWIWYHFNIRQLNKDDSKNLPRMHKYILKKLQEQ